MSDLINMRENEELKSAYFSGWVNAINYVIKHELFIEPKRGNWSLHKSGALFVCSACGETSLRTERYCPNCGAKMEKTER